MTLAWELQELSVAIDRSIMQQGFRVFPVLLPGVEDPFDPNRPPHSYGHEGAGSGLIVTTSAFAPSAQNVRTARDYPVAEAGRPTLRSWSAEMRTPGTGFFMAE